MNRQQDVQTPIPRTIPETGVTIAKWLPRSRAGVPGGLQETGAFHTRFSHVPIPDAALVPGTSARKRGALPRLALQAPPSETVGREDTPEERRKLGSAVGAVMSELGVRLLHPVYRNHPSLVPDQLRGEIL